MAFLHRLLSRWNQLRFGLLQSSLRYEWIEEISYFMCEFFKVGQEFRSQWKARIDWSSWETVWDVGNGQAVSICLQNVCILPRLPWCQWFLFVTWCLSFDHYATGKWHSMQSHLPVHKCFCFVYSQHCVSWRTGGHWRSVQRWHCYCEKTCSSMPWVIDLIHPRVSFVTICHRKLNRKCYIYIRDRYCYCKFLL